MKAEVGINDQVINVPLIRNDESFLSKSSTFGAFDGLCRRCNSFSRQWRESCLPFFDHHHNGKTLRDKVFKVLGDDVIGIFLSERIPGKSRLLLEK
ncbi:hypothetical protein IV203_007243 [Nitzschia inconspicua]|uniref:Uncharacterized protein n=1 Tax=Nitzschia inconspicua TaxID=303405 RepID=A0A9K3KF85_9STRA|nr:hypothetical protein IV203_007243 [Nitzschia inconspicua]